MWSCHCNYIMHIAKTVHPLCYVLGGNRYVLLFRSGSVQVIIDKQPLANSSFLCLPSILPFSFTYILVLVTVLYDAYCSKTK